MYINKACYCILYCFTGGQLIKNEKKKNENKLKPKRSILYRRRFTENKKN